METAAISLSSTTSSHSVSSQGWRSPWERCSFHVWNDWWGVSRTSPHNPLPPEASQARPSPAADQPSARREFPSYQFITGCSQILKPPRCGTNRSHAYSQTHLSALQVSLFKSLRLPAFNHVPRTVSVFFFFCEGFSFMFTTLSGGFDLSQLGVRTKEVLMPPICVRPCFWPICPIWKLSFSYVQLFYLSVYSHQLNKRDIKTLNE